MSAWGGGRVAFWDGYVGALLTSFYSWRLVFLTFFGKPRWAASEHIQHAVHGDHHDHPADEHSGDDVHHAHAADAHEGTAGYRPHESPISMLRSEEHTSELQSLMRISYAVFCLKKTT